MAGLLKCLGSRATKPVSKTIIYTMKKILFLLAFFSFTGSATVFAQTSTKSQPTVAGGRKLNEEQKINALIKYVAGLQGATFIRNGSEYPAKDAADHLEMKRRKAGDRVKTAREFIDGLATESYLSGKPYQIRMKDGKTYSSRDVLMKELTRLEKQN